MSGPLIGVDCAHRVGPSRTIDPGRTLDFDDRAAQAALVPLKSTASRSRDVRRFRVLLGEP